MTPHWLERTELLLGPDAMETLSNAHVLVLGLGGVGSFAVEFLARSGVGTLTLVDGDVVDPTNRNRQLQALSSTHGQKKADLLASRVRDINPDIVVHTEATFLTPDAMRELISQPGYYFALDCIDSVQPKLHFIATALALKLPFISSMGAGGRLDPSKIQIDQVEHSFNCPFAQHIRKRLGKEYNIRKGFPVVFSSELANKEAIRLTDGSNFKKSFYGTSAWIPAAFGLHAASYAVRTLMGHCP